MTMTTSSSPDIGADPDSLALHQVKPGVRFSRGVLRALLPDIETALFFGKLYELTYVQLSELLRVVLNSDVANALLAEGGTHSTDLQDYVLDLAAQAPAVEEGDVSFAPVVPKGEILPELWKQLEVEVAQSIKDVAAKLSDVVNHMPGKQGQMVFKSMRVLNAKRPTIGDFKTKIHHAPQKENLVILDDSGSVSASTVLRILEDVVALSYTANAHLALVSSTCRYWEPGSFGTDEVAAVVQGGGTHYETLSDLLDQDWGVVVTIADYDSSWSAKEKVARCKGRIDEVLDISLVNQPSFLAECVGQLADRTRPLLVAATSRVLNH